jgi:hypothetical protein
LEISGIYHCPTPITNRDATSVNLPCFLVQKLRQNEQKKVQEAKDEEKSEAKAPHERIYDSESC